MGRFSFTINDKDLGFEDFEDTVEDLKSSREDHVVVGLLSKDASTKHEGETDATMIDIAVWNEFGTGRIPSRPFIRQTFDTRQVKLTRIVKQLSGKIGQGELTKKAALEVLGDTFRQEVLLSIEKKEYAENADSTIKKKKSDKPLVDTGQLQQSINYEVR
jgi:hypothetical protein